MGTRWYLFENLSFIETNGFNIIKGAIPKIGSKIELSILKKMNANAKSLKEYTQTHGQSPIYYTRKLSHFVQILNFIPTILDKNGHKREPSELKK